MTERETSTQALREALAELIDAMERYEMSVEESPPRRHTEMMRRARAALAEAPAPDWTNGEPCSGAADYQRPDCPTSDVQEGFDPQNTTLRGLLREIAHGLGFHCWKQHEAFGLRDDNKVVREKCDCGARRERYVPWTKQRGEYD